MTKARELSDYTGLQGDLALKSPVASPVFTGNVGVGVTPETWSSNNPALQIGSGGVLYSHVSNGTRVSLQGNAYVNSSNADAYITTNEASQHIQEDGTHLFKVAPSGTADAAISWTTAMKITNNGVITVGTDTPFSSGIVCFDGGNNAYVPLVTRVTQMQTPLKLVLLMAMAI